MCLTLCDPVDGSPPGSSVHGILQAGIQAWVAMPSSCTVPLGKPWWKKVTQMKPTGPGLERTFTLLRIFFSLCSVFLSFSSSPIFLGGVLSPGHFSSLHIGSYSLYKSTLGESECHSHFTAEFGELRVHARCAWLMSLGPDPGRSDPQSQRVSLRARLPLSSAGVWVLYTPSHCPLSPGPVISHHPHGILFPWTHAACRV